MSLVGWKQIPNPCIFCAEHPRSKTAQTPLLDERVALFERAQVCVEDPLPLIVPVKVQPSRPVLRVPLNTPAVRFGQVKRIVGCNVFSSRVGPVAGFV